MNLFERQFSSPQAIGPWKQINLVATADIARHAFGSGIPNAINYKYAVYQFFVKLKNNRIITD